MKSTNLTIRICALPLRKGLRYMEEVSKMMRLKDAWTELYFHFTQPGGLIFLLETGGTVDGASVNAIEIALQQIKDAWENESVVPKYERNAKNT